VSTIAETARRCSERINLRVEPEVDEYLRHAAFLEHKSLSAFMLDAAYERARNVIEEQQRIELSAAEFSRVLDDLDRPAEVVAPLLMLAERVGARNGRERAQRGGERRDSIPGAG
jgi:uncharacterized protein (DUF1778 family)